MSFVYSVSSLFQMDVGTVYREPREFLFPWPSPDVLEASWRRSFFLGGGSFFLLDALELGGGVCPWKGRQGFLSHAKQAPRHVCPPASLFWKVWPGQLELGSTLSHFTSQVLFLALDWVIYEGSGKMGPS